MMRVSSFPLIAVWACIAVADKDNNYYPGFTNPNVKRKMYWRDAVNVLQDLDQFKALYIKYHNCVWSAYGNGADDDGVCYNGDVDEEEIWYIGRTPCFRANVAYTLYGVLKSDRSSSWDGNHCKRKNYINSFFSTYGVESFAEPFGIDTTYANSYCSLESYGDDGQNNERKMEENGNNYPQHTGMFYEGYTSSGTGCSRRGKFVLDTYKGSSCERAYKKNTVDTLDSFNSAIEGLGCYQIYGSDSNYQRELEDEQNEDEEGEDEEEGQQQQDNGGSIAYQILSYSRACSIRQFPGDCPDPFGIKKKYTRAYERASASGVGSGTSRTKKFFSWFFFSFGILLILLAFVMNRRARKRLKMGLSDDASGASKRSRRSSRSGRSGQSSKSEKQWFPKKIQFFKKTENGG